MDHEPIPAEQQVHVWPVGYQTRSMVSNSRQELLPGTLVPANYSTPSQPRASAVTQARELVPPATTQPAHTIDLEVALRLALGVDVPDELVRPRHMQPLAIKFLTASPGPLPTGRVLSVGSLDKVRAFPGVVQAELYLQAGETIRPVQLDGDRRGYVIAIAETNLEALERAEAAAKLVDVIVE